MQKFYFFLSFLLGFGTISKAQAPKPLSSVEIHNKIKKLNFLGSVLYLAAHPDDENTRLISYLSNKTHARTAYLSLTRGDGGQNLIGSELRENLGVLRTQELLAARRVDGGEQFFSRANDFGYSKHPDETLNIWEKDKVLHDVVWTIRQFRPDIIVNRFDHRSPGTTHGHHTTSAMLAVEAFDLTNNKNIYPNQLENVSIWQPQRLFFNTSWWFYGSKEKFEAADKSKMLSVDIGVYYPELGLSNNEIASTSRSQHKCQGFGTLNARGSQKEYLELLKGKMPENNNLFEGINTTWTRLKDGKKIENILKRVENNFNFSNPSNHLDDLFEAYVLIQNLDDKHWKTLKTNQIIEIIEACSGLFLDPIANSDVINPGSDTEINIEVLQRSKADLKLESIQYKNQSITQGIALQNNRPENITMTIRLENKTRLSTPYWLNSQATLGMYHVDNPLEIGLPETPNSNLIQFNFTYKGQHFSIFKSIKHKYADPAIGEIYEPFQVLPKVSASIQEDVYIFNSEKSKDIEVDITAWNNNIEANISLEAPKGWTISPELIPVNIAHKEEVKTVVFEVSPPKHQSNVELKAVISIDKTKISSKIEEINYDHIPKQFVLSEAKAKIVKLDIKKEGKNVAYIKGSGDVIPESLEHIGYTVKTLELGEITPENMEKFDAVVVGIRAYNVMEELDFKQSILFDFVKNGGNMIVQYNTNHRLKTKNIAPFPLTLSRDRVTDETAEVTFLEPNHPALNIPNKITKADFDNWVQERGLYFPNKWDKAFTPLFSMHDKGETPKEGSLLIAKYGKGHYIYTGISFFREFPAGVPGAYRLFANLVSLK